MLKQHIHLLVPSMVIGQIVDLELDGVPASNDTAIINSSITVDNNTSLLN